MAEKQTRCPTCASIYKVSVAQLTVAQGMVCCPKCSENFNALLYLLTVSTQQESKTFHSLENSPPTQEELITTSHQIETHLLDIFDRKIENSNIDLRTYLNNLNYFNNDPISLVIEPNLTTVDYSGYNIGQTAAKNLINHLKGVIDIFMTDAISLRAELIIRASSVRKT